MYLKWKRGTTNYQDQALVFIVKEEELEIETCIGFVLKVDAENNGSRLRWVTKGKYAHSLTAYWLALDGKVCI